jgi:hypothetical protein
LGGPLKEAEERALRSFRALRQRFPAARSDFEKAFYRRSDAQEYLAQRLSPADSDCLLTSQAVLWDRFQLVWDHECENLLTWQQLLKKAVTGGGARRTLERLEALFGPPGTQHVEAFLVFSSPDHYGGGANIDGRGLTLEVSALPTSQEAKVMGLFWHETIHLAYQPFLEQLAEKASVANSQSTAVVESIISTLAPRGWLMYETPKVNPELAALVKKYLVAGKLADIALIKGVTQT